ncbi:ligase-associated DNA damage response endonuclease PdeM [Lewinella sp. 4G2]|uniref:ligase-associated DNA damage response endonuclease PdeM n=1 Tax=Lewinella sp. 4G2 TaxID=1803372 RepID=UPI0007B4D004|nr:ligase-associated DNA damage response endonuclease PdeM [Lewinella sp. 4G2]OAV44193.1 hypothetical protein A3850_006660 [Lewinella sp. 4G2]
MEEVYINGNRLLLHPQKAIYWPAEKALLLSDLHLGKGAHFRKAGIPVPPAVADVNFRRLDMLIEDCRPERVLFLGDLFHSDHNHVWGMFCDYLCEHDGISFELVPGNHDILPESAYAESCMKMLPEIYVLGNLCLSHHPLEEEQIPADTYNIYGHIHPCVRLIDVAGNGMKLPAFFFGPTAGILPAFGEFTGCAEVKARAGDRVFVLAEGSVIGF